MGEKIIKANPGQPKEFKIPAVKGQKLVVLDLGENDPGKYLVVKKDIPEGIPTTWGDYTIQWFNNFGIRHKNKNGSAGDFANIPYRITVALEPAKKLFYFDGSAIQELAYTPAGSSGKVKAVLSIGDPAIGWGGR